MGIDQRDEKMEGLKLIFIAVFHSTVHLKKFPVTKNDNACENDKEGM